MKTEQIIAAIQALVGARLKVMGIRTDWQPHQYIISEEAAEWMNIHVQGYTTPDNIMVTERLLNCHCMQDGCLLMWQEHSVKTVVYLQCKSNMEYHYAKSKLEKMAVFMNEHGIDDYAFVDNKRGYKISERKVKDDASKHNNGNL